MKARFCWILVAGFSVAFTFSAVLAAQGIGSGMALSGARPSEPYTATGKTTHLQTLANGTTITKESTIKQAHDSSGKYFNETRTMVPDGGATREVISVTILDRVNLTTTFWNSDTKEAVVVHNRDPSARTHESTPADAVPPPSAVRTARPSAETHTEKLGTQMIAGVEATGIRITRVIPAGKEGNDQPVTITNERWFSTKLPRMILLSIDNDPRSGMMTTEMTEIERCEPDPSLFAIPEGYTVKDRYPDQQN